MSVSKFFRHPEYVSTYMRTAYTYMCMSRVADMRAIACACACECVCAGKYIRFIGGRGQIEPYVFRTMQRYLKLLFA